MSEDVYPWGIGSSKRETDVLENRKTLGLSQAWTPVRSGGCWELWNVLDG